MTIDQNNQDKSNAVATVITALLVALLVAVFLALPTMWLWNWLMPELFGVKRIDPLQALGVNMLSGIMFNRNHYSTSKSE